MKVSLFWGKLTWVNFPSLAKAKHDDGNDVLSYLRTRAVFSLARKGLSSDIQKHHRQDSQTLYLCLSWLLPITWGLGGRNDWRMRVRGAGTNRPAWVWLPTTCIDHNCISFQVFLLTKAKLMKEPQQDPYILRLKPPLKGHFQNVSLSSRTFFFLCGYIFSCIYQCNASVCMQSHLQMTSFGKALLWLFLGISGD